MEAVFIIYKADVQLVPKKQAYYNEILQYPIVKKAILAVELSTSLKYNQINIDSRKDEIVYARYMVMGLVKMSSPLSLNNIGKIFTFKKFNKKTGVKSLRSFNHSTVISGLEQINNIEYLGNRDERFILWNNVKETFGKL